MIEIVFAAAGVVLAAPAVTDYLRDGEINGKTLLAIVIRLRERTGHEVTLLKQRVDETPQDEIDAWLKANVGTADVDPDTREFFEQQLELIHKEMNP